MVKMSRTVCGSTIDVVAIDGLAAIYDVLGSTICLGLALLSGLHVGVIVEVGKHDQEDGRICSNGIGIGLGVIAVYEQQLEGVDHYDRKLCLQKKRD